ncbi:response regulator transcription factor [Paenibacillus dendritiformis]|uniref:LytR/AlgR family response regulator transcription factor n=1 Tax=Paenibacillus dendritiformis TaxID=130049 RepID=UPI001059F4DC|nr:LytTR family DNA-binding domain-containing protein [Paenibacillus dendritiformis]TDL57088.1 response regulator transcription factor [Paenibacillus dendritiformis]
MPGQNGIEIASVIRKQDRNAIIIFITDHKEYVYEVFEVLPFRFLRKPVTAPKLSHILLDAAEHIKMSKQLFFFQIGHYKYQLRCSDILYFEGAGRKVVIHANQDTYQFYGKIADILPQLDTNLFCRIHASILVNMEYIRSIKKMAILLQNETQLPISKRYLNEVKTGPSVLHRTEMRQSMTYFQTTTDTIFFGLEVILSMIEILFILRLFNKVFGETRISHIKLYAAAAVAMLTITCGLRAVLNPVRPAAIPPVTVLCSIFFLLCYPPNRQKKVLYIGILLTISHFWILLYDLIVTPIEDKNMWLTLILCHVGFYLLLELIRKTDKGKQWSIPFHLWLLLMAITVASAAGLSVMEYYISNREDPYLLTVEIPFSLIFLLINLSLFVVAEWRQHCF